MSSQRQSASHEYWDGPHAGETAQLHDESYSRSTTLGKPLSLEQLSRTVEREIIPRLLLAHKTDGTKLAERVLSPVELAPSDVEHFTRLVLKSDISALLDYVDGILNRGAPVASVLLNLFAPSARLLGEYWENDLCDFAEVTVGLSRLQQLLRELRPEMEDWTAHDASDGRILLLPAPGEQHTFGISIVEEFFRRDAWDVWSGAALSRKKIVEVVRTEPFDVLGLSLSCERFFDDTAATIRTVRKSSCNPYIAILVGGPLFIERPDLGQKIGADGCAADGRQAVERARAMMRTAVAG